RLLDIARAVHMPGNAEDFCAGIALAADPGEPGGAALEDVGADRDGLDIVDRRRAAVEPDRGGKRRLEARLAFAPFQAFEQPGLLATDVRAGATMQIELEIVARTAGVLTQEAGTV